MYSRGRILAFWVITLVWLTGLTIWWVIQFGSYLDKYKTVVNIPSGPFPISQQGYAVQVGDNTVWIISQSTKTIEVIKSDGTNFTSEVVHINSK